MTSSQLACYLNWLVRYRRGQGFKSRTSLNFSGFLFATANVASKTAMVFFTFTASSRRWQTFLAVALFLKDKLKLIFVVHLKHIDSRTPEIESHTINSVDENNEYI